MCDKVHSPLESVSYEPLWFGMSLAIYQSMKLTNQQADAICGDGGSFMYDQSRCGLTEVKRLSLTVSEFAAYLLIEVGMPDDEGTMAQAFGRATLHLSIGKRGGIRTL